MDSRIPLDYALFQLTPTRTRCDLVICAGDLKEKIASGLLAPFLAHLKFAKDQISKGGYSITLSASASWFTKSTLERFVRFVSTPEVLERFITIEKEIAQIEYSISQSAYGLVPDEYSNKSANSAYKHEFNGTNDDAHEDDSKVQLHRALESRKTVLQNEQAMVYARALVAGFETDYLEDLICFADAFGSPRLREACLNFMELCNTKSNDGVWMDEVAAMQAYSRSQFSYMGTSGGILLAGEDDPSQELTINVHNGNSATKKQNGTVDGTGSDSSLSYGSHLPQYMHNYGGPMFYQGYPFPNMAVPPYYQGNLPWPPNVEDFRSKGKSSRAKGSRQDDNFDSSDSSSGSDSSNYKKRSSRKVVIRNINYITSERDGETERESDGDNTVVDNPKDQKVTEQWNIFENLLMMDTDHEKSMEKETEKVKKPKRDSFIENKNHVENVSPVTKKYNAYEEELFSHKFEESKTGSPGTHPELATKSSTIRGHKEGDWFMGSLPDKAVQEKSREIFDDHFQFVESKKNILVDDPLAVQARYVNPTSNYQPKTDDIVSESNLIKKLQEKVEATRDCEPDDLHMVLERDTAGQQGAATWVPEMEYENGNNKIIKPDTADDKKLPSQGNETKEQSRGSVGQGLGRKSSTLEAKSKALVGSHGKSKSDIIARNKKPTGTKTEEEEKRKKMEELLSQRQKRIAERSASSVKTAKSDKSKAQLGSRDTKKSDKPVLRSSTINRLSAARVINPKVSVTERKLGNKPRKTTTKENDVLRPSFSKRPAGAEKKMVKPDKVKHQEKNLGPKNAKGFQKEKVSDLNNVKQSPSVSSVNKIGNGVDDFDFESSPVLRKDAVVSNGNGGFSPDKTLHHSPTSPNKALTSTFNTDEDNGAKEQPNVKVNPEISVTESLTPPMDKSHSRKKWDNGETSPKALSGFKKLLFFGRRR